MITLLVVGLALFLDTWLGEPPRYHPLVGFGRLVTIVEERFYGTLPGNVMQGRWRGLLAVIVLTVPLTLITAATIAVPFPGVLDALILYLAIGRRSLAEHADRVRQALKNQDIAAARRQVGFMVSRDTAALQPPEICKATVESVLENGNDAVFGAIFWFAVGGVPAVVAYRLINTLDAMWGYRNNRYRDFGWAAARLDDVLNFIPARLTALGYALVGNTGSALRCWFSQGRDWKSPNAGPVMAAGAGSLGVVIGGPACYGGLTQQRPLLGEGRTPDVDTLSDALTLIKRSLVLWLIVLATVGIYTDGGF
ncbi:MAG: cobalamin biosynthesis protein [Candidatus Competibacteraceae bacterium]|nr:cobalamin biosynthesis protein [Candidatus Competibacteraceae bacterium]